VTVVALWAADLPGLPEAAPTETATTPAATSASTASPVAKRFIHSSLRLDLVRYLYENGILDDEFRKVKPNLPVVPLRLFA
jgi:hypothetical protein